MVFNIRCGNGVLSKANNTSRAWPCRGRVRDRGVALHAVAGRPALDIAVLLHELHNGKRLAAVGLWVGFDALPLYLLSVALAGGLIAGAFATMRSVPLPRFLLGQPWALRLHRQDGGIPYGIALAAGALIVFPQTIWFERLAGW